MRKMTGCAMSSVSYTHLDVYKRQLHGTAVFFLYDALYICKGQRCDIIPQLDKLLAIAFTEHILPACHDLSDFNEGRDVYKRQCICCVWS